jgi:hypothetical protein
VFDDVAIGFELRQVFFPEISGECGVRFPSPFLIGFPIDQPDFKPVGKIRLPSIFCVDI